MIGSCRPDFSVSYSRNMSESTWKWVGWTWESGVFSIHALGTGGYDSVCTLEGPQLAWGCRETWTWGWHHKSTQWGAAESLGMSLKSHRCGTRRTREAFLSFIISLQLCACEEEKEVEREEAWGQKHTASKIFSFILESVGNSWIANPTKSRPPMTPHT